LDVWSPCQVRVQRVSQVDLFVEMVTELACGDVQQSHAVGGVVVHVTFSAE